MEELKRCPFCGGKAEFETKECNYSNYRVGFNFTIKCCDCKCELPSRYSLTFTLGGKGNIIPSIDERQKALEQWNSRA